MKKIMKSFLTVIVIALMSAACSGQRQQSAENHLAAETENGAEELTINIKQTIELNETMASSSDPDYAAKIEVIGWSRNGLLAYRYFTPAGGYGGWNHNFVILNTITDEIIGHSSVNLDREDIEYYKSEFNSSLKEHNITGHITDPSAKIEGNNALQFPLEDFQCWLEYEKRDVDAVEWKLLIGNGSVQKTITQQRTESPFLNSIRIAGFYKSPYENRIAVLVNLVFIYPADESFGEGIIHETVSCTPMLFGCNMNVGFN